MSSNNPNRNTNRRKGKQNAESSQFDPINQAIYDAAFQSYLENHPPFDPSQIDPSQFDPSQYDPTLYQTHFDPSLYQTQPSRNPRFRPQVQTQRQTPIRQQQRPSQNYRDVEEGSDESNDSDSRHFGPLSDTDIDMPNAPHAAAAAAHPAPPTKCPPTKWTTDEELELTTVCLDVGEDPVVGNNQSRTGYWRRVVDQLKAITTRRDVVRNEHQCNSKWKDLQAKVNAFSEIYNNLKRSKGPSGTGESDLVELARIEYSKRFKQQVFKHEKIWQFLRNHPKWATTPPMDEQPPKRSRTSESSDYSTNPTTDFDIPSPPRRKGKNPATSSSGTNISDEASTKFTEFVETEKADKIEYRKARLRLNEERQRDLSELKAKHLEMLDREELRREKEEERRTREEKRRDRADFVQPHDHLTGVALEIVLEEKREIAARWGWRFME